MNGRLLIDGKWVECNKKLESLNPATGEIIGTVCLGGEKEVNAAVKVARQAYESWKNTNIWSRAELLKKIADEIIRRTDELKELITTEMGRPLPESDIEVIETSDMINYFANEGKTYLEGESIPINPDIFPNKFSYTIYEPIGVIGIIKPWNYPLELPFWSLAPALLAGNTIVFKPSELTPFVGIEIGKICQDAGIPDGVVNIITGDKNTGKHLVNSDVDMISFTGSVEAGKDIMKNSADKLHKISLELGGSDPFIVFSDADFDEAINGALWGRFTNCGQVCVAAKRIFVEETIFEKFVTNYVERVKQLNVGNGLEKTTDVGPLVSEKQRERIKMQIEEAVQKGARIECGGKFHQGLQQGYFFEPTVITNINENMKVMCEEVFGPVAVIKPFKDEGEAIKLANNSYFGLGASVWTTNLDTAFRVTKQLESGMVWINEINVAYAQCPWGGIKNSGTGRELSKYGIREYANIKHVNIDYGNENTRPWWFPYKGDQ